MAGRANARAPGRGNLHPLGDVPGPERMKAVFYERYGPLENLQVREVEKPSPEEGRVLVKVAASSLNAADYHGAHGGFARLFTGLLRPKDPRMGTDVAGTVEAVGPKVTRFKPGDEVFGAAPGAYAEYASAREDRLALKPPSVSFEQAGASGIAAITALQGLRDRGRLHAGQKVLVNGASGGVGTFAVEIAKAYGAEVTAVCSPGNVDRARAIGADHVIDYTREDFTRSGLRYDLIFDIVGNHSARACRRALNPGGRCLIVGVGFPRIRWPKLIATHLLGPIRSRIGDRPVGFMGIAKFNAEDLATLGELLGAGKIVPVIDRRYPMRDILEAFRYFGQGHARGKVVIAMDRDGATAGVQGGGP